MAKGGNGEMENEYRANLRVTLSAAKPMLNLVKGATLRDSLLRSE